MEIYEKVPKEKLIEFSGEHLYYEIDMLYGVSQTLWDGTSNFYLYNALLESFVIHASIILDFFYRPQDNPDDAKAAHYMKDIKKWKAVLPRKTADLENFIKKRNKEVVHLSYRRLEVKPEEKRWRSPRITNQIKKLVDLFLNHADPELLHPKIYELRSHLYKPKYNRK